MPITIPPKSRQPKHIHKEQNNTTKPYLPVGQIRFCGIVLFFVNKIQHTQKINHDPAPKPADPQETISGTQKSVADQPTTLEALKSTAETHENNKTALILGSIIVGSVALIIYEIYLSILWLPHTTTQQQAQQEPTNYYQTSLQLYRSSTAAKTLWTR